MQKLYFGVKLYSKQIVNFAGTGHPKKVACRNGKILSYTGGGCTDCVYYIRDGSTVGLHWLCISYQGMDLLYGIPP